MPGGAVVQEQISNTQLLQGNATGTTNWAPLNNNNPKLYYTGSIIHDIRNCGVNLSNPNADLVSKSYSIANPGQAFIRVTQKIQILLPNGCGGNITQPLGTFKVTMFKGPAGTNTYKVMVQ